MIIVFWNFLHAQLWNRSIQFEVYSGREPSDFINYIVLFSGKRRRWEEAAEEVGSGAATSACRVYVLQSSRRSQRGLAVSVAEPRAQPLPPE